MPSSIPFESQNIAVGTSFTTLATITLSGIAHDVSLMLVNSGSSATSDFKIQRKLHDDADWTDYLGGTDFDTATQKCNASNTGPHELPSGQSAWVDFDPGAAVAVRFQAKVASGTATVTLLGGARIEK